MTFWVYGGSGRKPVNELIPTLSEKGVNFLNCTGQAYDNLSKPACITVASTTAYKQG